MRTIRACASGVVSSASAPPGRKSLLLDSVSEALVLWHYSAKTRPAYVGWVRRFVSERQRAYSGVRTRRASRAHQCSRCAARPPTLVGEQHGAGVAPCCQRPTVHHGLNQRVERLELLSHSATAGVKLRGPEGAERPRATSASTSELGGDDRSEILGLQSCMLGDSSPECEGPAPLVHGTRTRSSHCHREPGRGASRAAG